MTFFCQTNSSTVR